MKKLIIISLSITIQLWSFSQETSSFIDTSKIWSVIYNIDAQGQHDTWTIFYNFSGDTVINKLIYKKIYCCFDTTFLNWINFNDCFVREDSGKVYRLCNGIDNLFYDFNLNLGDTFPNTNYQLIAIDSVEINNAIKKRFKWQDQRDYTFWIEGIGSLKGLFNTSMVDYITYPAIDFGEYRTSCVLRGSSYLYYSPPCFEKSSYNYNDSPSVNSLKFKIYPTIVSNSFLIDTEYSSYRIEISDIIGRTYIDEIFSGAKIIDCSSLRSGYYIVKLTYGNEMITRKIIKL
jgi:hypothetical protein